jgi:pimeloyl-ACP methyl ester carboxylesterase
LLHGYAETSDSWAPLAAELVKSYTVRRTGPARDRTLVSANGRLRQENPGRRYQTVVTAVGHDRASIVSRDIGIMVAYAYAALYPDKVEHLVVMDAPLPGIEPWDQIVRHPAP